MYLKMQNPKIIDAKGNSWTNPLGLDTIQYNKQGRPDINKIARDAKKSGHDGLVVKNVVDAGTVESSDNNITDVSYAVFEPTQIKSVNNQGTFDPKDPRILYGGAAAAGAASMTPEEAEAAGINISSAEKMGEAALGVGAGRGATLAISQHDNPDPSFMETLKAAWQRENLIGSTLSSNRSMMDNQEFFEIDPDYNPFDDLEGYEEHEDKFVDVFNKKAADAVKADIDRERKK